jgi:choline monooxygenase
MGHIEIIPEYERQPEHGLTEVEKQYPLPPSRFLLETYKDPDRYRQELEHVFFKSWFPVGASGDIPDTGDYMVWDKLEQTVMIVRQDDGSVSAWHNVCQHRGARLVEESGRCASGKFKCPWHGFVYNLQGEVTSVPLRDSFDPAELDGLRAPAVRTEEWGAWIWLTFSDDVPPLEVYLGEVGEELAGYGLEDFMVVYSHTAVLDANWKLVLDAFNETWHVPFTHKDSLSTTVMWREAVLHLPDPHSWMTIPIRGFTEKAAEGADHRESHLCHYLAFPNTIFSCFPTHLQMWSAWPLSLDKTMLIAYQVAGPTPAGMTDEKWARRNQRDWEAFLHVLDEDSEVINHFASQMKSRGYTRNLFNTAESRITQFHEQIDAYIAKGL